jgi:hypothetical protein
MFYSKGVSYLGAFIKPNRIYVSKRTKGNFYNTIQKQNKIIENKNPTKEEQLMYLSSMNSYLGILGHYKSYNLCKLSISENLSKKWNIYYTINNNYNKFDKA